MREKLIDLIKSIAPAVELDDPDLNLAEDMDSIDIIALISELEDEFDIEITMEEKTEENFENVDTLLKMIQRLQ
ncbi:MAG: acyl carrier protein [Eubacterium sp.]|nr:acyl carrier protein [Eubacterium sp.]